MKPEKEVTGPMQINLREVLGNKLGSKAKFVPGFVTRFLEWSINANKLNDLLVRNHPKMGADFCRGVLADLNVCVEGINVADLPPAENRKVLIVSNHPLGGLDGMALIDFFTQYYGGRVHFVVNDLLMHVQPLSSVFVPVNKHGGQSHGAVNELHEALSSDDPVLIFPAGLVSRMGKNGTIADLEWRRSFINMAVRNNRAIVPVWFDGVNTRFFYRFARWRKRLGLKFNIEMVRLPRELFAQSGKTLRIVCGKAIDVDRLKAFPSVQDAAAFVRQQVDNLRKTIH